MKPPFKNLLLAISSLRDPAPLLNLIFYLLDVKNQFTEPKYCKTDPGDFIFYRLYRVMLAKSIKD
jgi:hypothetical protein